MVEEVKMADQVDQLIDTMHLYSYWISLGKQVYAVDIRHECAYPSQFEPVKNNENALMKVILFDQAFYYGLRSIDTIFRDAFPGSLLRFYCPCCLEQFWNPPTYQ